MENSHKISQQLRILTILLILFLTHTIFANAQNAVGSVNGALTVNDMGAAVYSVTFDAPNGGRMTPKIGLAYSSQSSGYGLAGYGIDVTGISVITSGGRDMFHNGKVRGANYDKDSNFYLDGKRLVLQAGEDGEDGTVYAPEGDPYTKVTLHGDIDLGTAYFEVIATDGTVFTYGGDNNSRLQVSKAGDTRTAAWYVTMAVNRYGESISYAYVNENLCVSPQAITYGTDRGLTAEVKFFYRDMADANVRTFRIGSQQGMRNKLLSSVSTSINNQVHRKYDFTYDETASDKFSRLVRVTESNGKGESLNPTVLTWNTEKGETTVSHNVSYTKQYPFEYTSGNVYSVDINGDGIGDIVRIGPGCDNAGVREKTIVRILLSKIANDGSVSFSQMEGLFAIASNSYNMFLQKVSAIDFDGDGLNDLVLMFHFTGENPDEFTPRTKIVILYGKNILGNNSYYTVDLGTNVVMSPNIPVATTLDIDGDGREDLFVLDSEGVEREVRPSAFDPTGTYYRYTAYDAIGINYDESYGPNASSEPHFVLANGLGRIAARPHFSFKLCDKVKKLFTADCNNDGLSDLIIIHNNCYTIYYNNGYRKLSSTTSGIDASNSRYIAEQYRRLTDVFTDDNSYVGSQLKDFWRMEQGDFDGDGLLDFFYHDKNTASYGIAYNNGDGTFRIQTLPNNWGCYEHIDSNEDDDKFAIRVLDFDRDGKSDVVISKYEFGDTKIKWLRSTGYGFEPWYEHAYKDKDNSCEGLISTGDFDGDGIVEVANIGRLLNADYSENTENAIHIYNIGNKDAALGRITAIQDGFGNVTNVSYDYATSPKIYTNGESAYPVNSYTLPIALVTNVTSDNMNVSYQYENMKMHIAGRGLMGFSAVETYDAIHECSTRREITEWDDTYWIAKKIKTTTDIAGNGSGNGDISTNTSSYTIENVGNNWYSYLSDLVDIDFDGNTTYRRIHRDKANGQVVNDCQDKDEENDRQYTVNRYASEYKNIAGMWLPPHQYVMSKHPDDDEYFIDSKDYEYDEKGNVVAVITGGSSMYLGQQYIDGLYHRTDYTYDRWGNVTSETFHGNDESTGHKYYEYDPSGRFIVKTYTVPESTTTTYTYDVFGNILTETDETDAANPLTTTHEYDGWGRRTRTVNPDGTETTFRIYWEDDINNIGGWFTQSCGTRIPYEQHTYDTQGREIEYYTSKQGCSLAKYMTYNAKGQIAKTETQYGKRKDTETFTYDARGRVLTDTHSSGAGLTYEYGRNTVTATDAAGRSVTKEYDAWGNVKKTEDAAQTVEYAYYSNGKAKSITTADGTLTMEYDEFGRRTRLSDPDAGTTLTTYDKTGNVLKETDGRGVTTTYTYDALGRITERRREKPADRYANPSVTTYTYGTSGNSKGRIVKKDCDGKAVTYEYDDLGRVVSESRGIVYNHDGTRDELRKTYTYNSKGQVEAVTYPASHSDKGLTIGYVYDNDGTLRLMLYNNNPSNRLYRNYGNDGLKMQSRSDYLGNITTHFDNDGYLISRDYNHTYYNKNKERRGISDTLTFSWDKTTGDLLSKTIRNQTEWYAYDNLDRLTGVSRDNIGTMSVEYAGNGNIISKSGIGEYTYDEGDKPHAVREVENTDGIIDDREVYTQYDLNGKVASIWDKGYTAYSWYDYGPDDEKWSSWGWSPEDTNMEWDVERVYWGNYERLTKDYHIREYYFLDNDVLIIRDNPYVDIYMPDIWHENIYQMERDNIGNVVAIYDLYHRKVFEAEYDAWGRQTVIKDEIGFNHGFTGHEMLPQFGLIHMDGRVYDPAIGRFLSPDNYVQLPENSQSFNRYSYCINNPLKYTDPSGQNFLVALAINVGVSMFCAAAEGQNIWKAAAFGALGSGLSYGIGAAFGHAAGGFGNELLRAGAHGISGGVQSALQGGSFYSGFAGGVLASMAGSGAQWAGWSDAGIVNATTAAGAIGSLAFGGDWYNGASLGFSIGALNHTGDDDSQERCYYLEPAPTMYIEPMPWQVSTGVTDATGLAGTAATAYAAPTYLSNWFQPTYWTGKNGKLYSSAILKKQPNGKYVRGYSGYVNSKNIAAKATRIPRGIGQGLGFISMLSTGISAFRHPSVENTISLLRSIGSAANFGFALFDAYTTVELWNYNTFIKPRIEDNIRHGRPWDFGTGLDRNHSTGSMP